VRRSRRRLGLAPARTLAQLAPSPSVDEELRWFFHAEDGGNSSSNFGRMLASIDDDDGHWRTPGEHAAAARRHRVIGSDLKAIPDHDAGVLQCAYDPRPWPVLLVRELGRLTGIVVRLSCNRATWPDERGRQLAVDADNAERLHAMIRAGGEENIHVLRDLRHEAEDEFAHALGAYVAVRRGHVLRRVQ
jgi:hypothetical protein